MAHRLLHTLVFSSMFMLHGTLGGCARSNTREEPDADTEDMVDAGAPVATDAGEVMMADAHVPAASDAGAPDAGAPDAGDPRFCEPGWPTTKGQWTAEVDGELWGCEGPGHWTGEDAGPIDVSECCRVREEG